MPDIKSDLVTFLRNNVSVSLAVPFSNSDDIGFAEYSRPKDYPQIAVVSSDPVILGGGETGYTAIDGTDSGPIQDYRADVLVDCWGGPVDDDIYQGVDTHPDPVASELGDSVHTALTDAASDGAPSGYEWVGAEPPRTANDVERDPPHYREQVIAYLKPEN